MDNRISRKPEALSIRQWRILPIEFRISVLLLLLAVGCGAPGEPTPPAPRVPVRITDLAAQQTGDAVQLTFTLPAKTVSRERLAEHPAIEVLRGAVKPDGSPDPKSFRPVETIPGALVGQYRAADEIQI